MARNTRIALWLDNASGNAPAWIVSFDDLSPTGETAFTKTHRVFAEDDYAAAREAAITLGRERGMTVIDTDDREVLYDPAEEVSA